MRNNDQSAPRSDSQYWMVADANGTFIIGNPATYRYLGKTFTQLIGRPVPAQDLVLAAMRESKAVCSYATVAGVTMKVFAVPFPGGCTLQLYPDDTRH